MKIREENTNLQTISLEFKKPENFDKLWSLQAEVGWYGYPLKSRKQRPRSFSCFLLYAFFFFKSLPFSIMSIITHFCTIELCHHVTLFLFLILLFRVRWRFEIKPLKLVPIWSWHVSKGKQKLKENSTGSLMKTTNSDSSPALIILPKNHFPLFLPFQMLTQVVHGPINVSNQRNINWHNWNNHVGAGQYLRVCSKI